MKRFVSIVLIAGLCACGAKKDKDKADPGSNTPVTQSGGDAAAKTCPPGNALGKDGACVVVITPEKVAIVEQQQTRLDELAKLLDKADLVGAPIELLNGFRQLDIWKQLLAATPKLKVVDDAIGVLGDAVKQLRVLRDSLASAAVGLGDLKGSLDKVLKDPGVARQLEDLKTQVSTKLHATIDPLEQQVVQTIQKVLVPVTGQIGDISDLVLGACTMAKLSGGSDKMKDLCTQAKDAFAKALGYLEDLKTRPQVLFDQLTAQLTLALTTMLDTSTKDLLAAAQKKVSEALKLPAMGTGSGSGSAGSATP